MTKLYVRNISSLYNGEWMRFLSLLPQERREWAERLRCDHDSARCVGAWLLLREALTQEGLDVEALALEKGPFGKPCFPGGPEFSISHAGPYTALALSDHAVGVDIEAARCTLDIAVHSFAAAEIAAAQALSGDAQRLYLQRLWVAKEAYVKALGTGLSTPLNSFYVLLHEDSAELRQGLTAQPLYLTEFSAGAYRIAVAGVDDEVETCFCLEKRAFPQPEQKDGIRRVTGGERRMLAIWGLGELSLKLYRRIPEQERKNVCLVAPEGTSSSEAGEEIPVMAWNRLNPEDVAKLLIPCQGGGGRDLRRESALYRRLVQDLGLGDDQLWLMDDRAFDRGLRAHGTLEAFLRSKTLPYLFHLEYEVTHHCNLNCRGCTHFAPLSPKRFGNLEQFRRDLTRLRQFVDYFDHIELMGGEPLLNPELSRFVEAARAAYPDTRIEVLTNGMLLGSVDEGLKETMKRTGACFRVTLYPPFKQYVSTVMRETALSGVPCEKGYDADFFFSVLRLDGDSDPAAAHANCFQSHCTILEDGKLSRCALAHKIGLFQAHYQLDCPFPDCDLDLYAEDLTPWKLQAYLMNPIGMCSFCGKPRYSPWAPAGRNPKMGGWLSNGPYQAREDRDESL